MAHDRASHRHALPLTTRELPRLAFQQRAETEQVCGLVDAPAYVIARQATDAKAVRHVVEYAHVRIERVVLEHHGDVAFRWVEAGHVVPIDQHAAGGWTLQPGDQTQQGRLATARRADDDQHLAIGERQVDAVQHIDQAEALAQATEFESRHGCQTAIPAEAPAIVTKATSPKS